MSEATPEKASSLAEDRSGAGVNPYATAGGGVTFEQRVAVKFLAHLLVGDSTFEIGAGRRVVSVAFQQAPDHTVDDLIICAARPDELTPSLVLAVAVRRKPEIVQSDESTRKLIHAFVREVINTPANGREYRCGLVVAGPQRHAKQLAILASHAAGQMDAPGFFKLVRTPNKFREDVRRRLKHLEQLVQLSLSELGVAGADATAVQLHTWRLLARLFRLYAEIRASRRGGLAGCDEQSHPGSARF